jgi:cytidylate kinase
MERENLLLKYFDTRLQEPVKTGPGEGFAPFVTLSREFGCPSKLVAKELCEELNRRAIRDHKHQWQCISKEIVEEAAAKLKLEPEKIRHFDAESKEALYEVLSAFSTNYKSSRAIERTTREVVRTFARRGHAILIGRGGVAITQGWPNSLHVRLIAPKEWRIEEYAKRHSLTHKESENIVAGMDKKRTDWIEIYLGHKMDPNIFDIIINCKPLSIEEITNGIIGMMEAKKLI